MSYHGLKVHDLVADVERDLVHQRLARQAAWRGAPRVSERTGAFADAGRRLRRALAAFRQTTLILRPW